MRIAVGGYAGGVHLLERVGEGARFVQRGALPLESASFLGPTPSGFLAVSERARGLLTSVAVREGSLGVLDSVDLGQAGPCHVRYSARSGVAVITNYPAGSVSVVPVEQSGALGRPMSIDVPPGGGPVADRQEAPHPHQSTETPWGTVLVSDLGADRLLEFTVDRAAEPRLIRALALPEGTGPRHMTWAADRLIVVGELSSSLYVVDVTSAGYRVGDPVLTHRGGGSSVSEPSHVQVSETGRWVLVLNRGRDTISSFRIDGTTLRLVQEASTGGAWPRHFAQHERSVLVANQHSSTVCELKFDEDSGALAPAVPVLELAEPACILPL